MTIGRWAVPCYALIVAFGAAGGRAGGDEGPKVVTENLGPMGTGTNFFRTGLAHSSGVVYLGTYGPAPALVWKYDPAAGRLTKLGAPGEYQLDSMVEAPDGKVFIGTAYEGLVYELDPRTDRIRSLGSPPVNSTSWIFTMIRTRDGEIYGAKGVGLFHLDWKTGRMESCGLVPGDHRTPGPGASNPIIRTLEERPDGVLWGDTNRWIFTFDPKTRRITPVADVVAHDDACYAVMHALGPSPVEDLYFHVYSRFSGRTARHPFGVCRARTGRIEPLPLEGLEGQCLSNGWWKSGGRDHWLIAHRAPDAKTSTIAVLDIVNKEIVERWAVPGNDLPPQRLAGQGLWFISSGRGTLYRADPERRRLVTVAVNPEPVACRSLAVSPAGKLGAYTYDCGFLFTHDLATGRGTDHGRVDPDDHRCVYGPAAFAGRGGRYFVANHGDTLPKLWLSDLHTGRHRPLGDTAVQLRRLSDGTVCGTFGALAHGTLEFSPERCWTAGWQARPGRLFRYRPGEDRPTVLANVGPVGPFAEAPGRPGMLLLGLDKKVVLYDLEGQKVIADTAFPSAAVAAAGEASSPEAYFVLTDGTLLSCRVGAGDRLVTTKAADGFGPAERGCFVLPKSGRLIGLAGDGAVSVFDSRTRAVTRARGPAPLAAGPAVHPTEDAWFFADRRTVRYSLSGP